MTSILARPRPASDPDVPESAGVDGSGPGVPAADGSGGGVGAPDATSWWAERLRVVDVVVLALLLAVGCLLLPVSPFTTDEGEILLQQATLDRTGQWAVAHPAPDLDPSGDAFPMYRIEREGDRYLPHVKHPVWTTALRPLYRWWGVRGLLAAHLAALGATALGAALLTRRLGRGGERAVFWAVGVASPVAVGATIGLGHSVGAAAVTWALVAASPMTSVPRLRRLVPLAAALAAGTLVRNEVVLVGIALALVAVRYRRWTVASTATGAVGAAYVANNAWLRAIWGATARSFTVVDEGQGWLSGRVGALVHSLAGIEPQVLQVGAALLSLVGAGLAAPAGASVLQRRLGSAALVLAPLVALTSATARPVAGLLIVTPLLVVGLRRVGPTLRRDEPAVAVLQVAGLGAAAITATQYADGGGLQWGGRFFHVVVPALLAVVVPRLVVRAPGLWHAAAVAALAWSVVGVVAVVELRHFHGAVVASVDAAASRVPGTDRPVVAGDLRVLGAVAWDHVDDWRGLNTGGDRGALDDVAARLESSGVRSWLLVSTERRAPRRVGAYRAVTVDRDVSGSMWLLRMERS